MDKETTAGLDAVAGQVERPVRPLVERLEAAARAWGNNLTVCGDYMPSPTMLLEAKAEIERLRAAIGVAAGALATGGLYEGVRSELVAALWV